MSVELARTIVTEYLPCDVETLYDFVDEDITAEDLDQAIKEIVCDSCNGLGYTVHPAWSTMRGGEYRDLFCCEDGRG